MISRKRRREWGTGLPYLWLKGEKREIGFFIELFHKSGWQSREKDFESGPDNGLQEMPSADFAVRQSERSVSSDLSQQPGR